MKKTNTNNVFCHKNNFNEMAKSTSSLARQAKCIICLCILRQKETSSPNVIDRSPESQHEKSSQYFDSNLEKRDILILETFKGS